MIRRKPSNELRSRPNEKLTHPQSKVDLVDPQGNTDHAYGDEAAAVVTYPSETH